MTSLMQDLKKVNYKHYHSVWKIAQTGDLESLSNEDRLLSRIMMEHEEYHNQFEISDLLHDHQYDTASEVNPFLHIILHQIVENQLESRDPIEAFQFLNAMRQHKVSRHEAIHCVGAILSFLLEEVLRGSAEFDMERYRSLLKRLKNKKPDQIMPALEHDK